jgi:hypothetical protein
MLKLSTGGIFSSSPLRTSWKPPGITVSSTVSTSPPLMPRSR